MCQGCVARFILHTPSYLLRLSHGHCAYSARRRARHRLRTLTLNLRVDCQLHSKMTALVDYHAQQVRACIANPLPVCRLAASVTPPPLPLPLTPSHPCPLPSQSPIPSLPLTPSHPSQAQPPSLHHIPTVQSKLGCRAQRWRRRMDTLSHV